MYSRVLKQMREAVRLRHYIVTLHAVEEMDDDDFSIFDVEHCILHPPTPKMSITGKLVIITVYAT